MNTIRYLIFFLVFTLSPSVFADCEFLIKEVYESNGNKKTISVELDKLSNICEGSGAYEAHLVNQLMAERNFTKARTVLNESLLKEGEYNSYKDILLRLAVDVDYFQKLTQSNLTRDELENLKYRYQKLIHQYDLHNDYIIFLRLADIDMQLRYFDSALNNINKGLEVEPHSRFYSLLVIYMSIKGHKQEMIEAFEQAYNLNKNVFQESDTMIALSRGYASYGNFELAKKTLVKLLEVNPTVESTEDFIRAVEYVKNQIRNSKYKNKDA